MESLEPRKLNYHMFSYWSRDCTQVTTQPDSDPEPDELFGLGGLSPSVNSSSLNVSSGRSPELFSAFPRDRIDRLGGGDFSPLEELSGIFTSLSSESSESSFFELLASAGSLFRFWRLLRSQKILYFVLVAQVWSLLVNQVQTLLVIQVQTLPETQVLSLLETLWVPTWTESQHDWLIK